MLALSCAGALFTSADDVGTYEDTLSLRENGEYACDVPYGYLWEVDYIDGKIVGEDVTVCTTVEAYNACNPNWAITTVLKKQSDGVYVAVCDAIVGSGSVPVIELGEDQIAFVVHSAGSVPSNCLGSYENWVGKVVAVAIKAGDVFEVDLTSAPMTVYAVGPSSEESDPVSPTPVPPTQDGLLVIDGLQNDAAYTNATWFEHGVWQGLNDPQIPDLYVAYATFADDENIYVSVMVEGQGVDYMTALDYENWDQTGATDFRIWLKGDGMETRTFYDLLWNGKAFEPFRQKAATDDMLFAATYGEDHIFLELKLNKQALAVTEYYDLMVTYSTPFCSDGYLLGYNAFHLTSFGYGEDGKLPAGWSGNTIMYERYYCPATAPIAYGDVNGDGAIDGKDATRLLQYLANYDYASGTSTVEISDGADCNGDGIIDGRDSVRLLQYLANYDPSTGESSVKLGK